ncbi:Alpha/beta hydrolase [Gracilaria domingensis]|nr:Alpha/beta hydrolase [Gracilaria domingensis]
MLSPAFCNLSLFRNPYSRGHVFPSLCHSRNSFTVNSRTQWAQNPNRNPPRCVQEAIRVATTESSQTDYHLHTWDFRGFKLQYATAGVSSQTAELPALVLVHGFGANCQHWRRNLAPLASKNFRVFALDLIGFGMGEKPQPGKPDSHDNQVEYTFDYWTEQLRSFITTVVQPTGAVYLVANSIGAMVTMQFSAQYPNLCAANVFISPSLRQLNVRKRSWLQDITAPLIMQVLAYRPLGSYFLNSIAKPKQLSNVLREAYGVHEAVDDELVNIIAKPALTEGALDVFLAFISYDEGPIPEDFLPALSQPSMVIWGVQDQFEPYELGQALRHYSTVQEFVGMEGVGHCAHDENPEEVNDLICKFFQRQLERSAFR